MVKMYEGMWQAEHGQLSSLFTCRRAEETLSREKVSVPMVVHVHVTDVVAIPSDRYAEHAYQAKGEVRTSLHTACIGFHDGSG
jgi:hypothetical protein